MNYSSYNQSITNNFKKILSSLPLDVKETSFYLTKGKRVRSLFCYKVASSINCPIEDIIELASIIEIIHSISIIQDDVIDGGYVRRKDPTLNSLFSSKKTILSSIFLLNEVLTHILKKYPPFYYGFFISVIEELYLGEVLQDTSRDSINLLLSDYLDIQFKKTGSLFALSASLPFTFLNYTPSQIKVTQSIGYYYGLSFQFYDDFNDIHQDLFKHKINQLSTIPFLWNQINPSTFKKFLEVKDLREFSSDLIDLKKELQNILYKEEVKIKEAICKESEKQEFLSKAFELAKKEANILFSNLT